MFEFDTTYVGGELQEISAIEILGNYFAFSYKVNTIAQINGTDMTNDIKTESNNLKHY